MENHFLHKAGVDLIPQIKEGFNNLLSSKLRSFLAVLGIMIGTASVVAMVSCGQLATRQALAQFKKLGTDLLSVSIYSDNQGQEQSNGGQAQQKLTVKQAMDMTTAVPGILEVAPYATLFNDTSYAGKKLNIGGIIGATQTLQDVIKIDITQGRFISFLDKYAYYCVIGNKLAENLKKDGLLNPVGKQLHIGKNFFTIIGVAGPWAENSFFNQDVNNSIIIPLSTATIINKYADINNLVLKLNTGADIPNIKDGINKYINDQVSGKRTFIRSAQELIASMKNQRKILTLLLALIGSISLIVGGIGVMNIMLVSVVERRKEIGIRMAIGARRRDIQSLFLIESIALSLFGGGLGVIFGILTSYFVALFSNWGFTIFTLPPTIGFGVSVAIGIFFGFYPAYQASQLDPIETLRSD